MINTGVIMDDKIVSGVLHAYVAFDWGEEVDLVQAAKLIEAELGSASSPGLPRRRRTPMSIEYRPAPLVFQLPNALCKFAVIGEVEAQVEMILFDFATLSLSFRVPFSLQGSKLRELALELSRPGEFPSFGKTILTPLFQKLSPAIKLPKWSELTEEYFVFQFNPSDSFPEISDLLLNHSPWLASLLRLESAPLASEEIAESIKQRLQYSPTDLLVVDWAAAVLIDSDCEETLQTIQFANLQLLRYRYLDDLLDTELSNSAKWSRWPTTFAQLLSEGANQRVRELGALNIEATNLFERTGNVFKLLGDMYLSRTYRLLSTRFHLPAWEGSIRRNLEVIEDVYRVVADQAAALRAQILEVIIIALIGVELFLALWR